MPGALRSAAPVLAVEHVPLPAQSRLTRWRQSVEIRFQTFDIAPDLAEDIGSRTWFRGLGTLAGLGLTALSLWPDFAAVEAATTMPVSAAARDEFRSQMILPLAMGGESGRRMGPTSRIAAVDSVPERPLVRLTATLAQGDSFGRMLQRAGAGAGDAAEVSQLIAGAVALGEIEPGTRVDLTLGRRSGPGQPRPVEKLAFRARFDLDLGIVRRGGGLTLERRAIAVNDTPLRIKGVVGPSLYRSARAAGVPATAIQQYLQTIDQHISLESDLLPDDQFDIIVGYKRSARGESEAGELLYAGLLRSGMDRLQLLRWGGQGQFYEASGIGTRQSRSYAPVAGRITSRFGLRRHPVLGYARMHSGVDFGAGFGTPIYAVSDAVVGFSGWHGGHGKYVRLDHGGGLGSGYGHMSRIAVTAGAPVRAGQVIGYVGSTGLSTGPHLHFEVYRSGRKIDPMTVSFTTRAEVNQGELAAFKARLARIKSVVPGAALATIAARQVEIPQ